MYNYCPFNVRNREWIIFFWMLSMFLTEFRQIYQMHRSRKTVSNKQYKKRISIGKTIWTYFTGNLKHFRKFGKIFIFRRVLGHFGRCISTFIYYRIYSEICCKFARWRAQYTGFRVEEYIQVWCRFCGPRSSSSFFLIIDKIFF